MFDRPISEAMVRQLILLGVLGSNDVSSDNIQDLMEKAQELTKFVLTGRIAATDIDNLELHHRTAAKK